MVKAPSAYSNLPPRKGNTRQMFATHIELFTWTITCVVVRAIHIEFHKSTHWKVSMVLCCRSEIFSGCQYSFSYQLFSLLKVFPKAMPLHPLSFRSVHCCQYCSCCPSHPTCPPPSPQACWHMYTVLQCWLLSLSSYPSSWNPTRELLLSM